MTEQQGNALAALYPSPPTFYQAFTAEKIERIEALRRAQQETANPTASDEQTSSFQIPVQVPNLPDELRFLQPPDPPGDGIYRCFGDNYNLSEALPSLASQGITQLYTTGSETPEPTVTDHSLTLKRLSKSLLLNFLELITILSVNPEEHTEKGNDLRTLFINFHHLLNEYRPHQARESLILLMEEQLRITKEETEGIERMKRRVEVVLDGLSKAMLGEEGLSENGKAEEGAEEQKALWDQLDSLE